MIEVDTTNKTINEIITALLGHDAKFGDTYYKVIISREKTFHLCKKCGGEGVTSFTKWEQKFEIKCHACGGEGGRDKNYLKVVKNTIYQIGISVKNGVIKIYVNSDKVCFDGKQYIFFTREEAEEECHRLNLELDKG